MIHSIPVKTPWGIGISKNLKKNRVKSVTIEGHKYSLFRNGEGKVSLIDSVCPHRGADLSKGKVINNCIQCPYHGWEFDSDGKLSCVPSTDASLPKKGDVDSFSVVESGGFMWLVDSMDDTLPTEYCDELFDDNWTKVYGSKILQGNILDWIMNGVDISHINYVHDFANEDNGKVDNVIIKSHENYVDCFANVKPKASSSLTEHMQPNNGSEIHSRFIAPNTTSIRIKLKEPYEFITYTTLLPVDETHTKMSWCLLYPKHFLLNLPFVFNRIYNEMFRTVAQDEEIIKNITSLPTPYTLNVPCDLYQIEALKKLGLHDKP
jgi:phenylpropionate dioxygenase-like ring-hydroxylating dioxygenase large terminal subunit